MRGWFAVVLLLQTGCGAAVRVTVAPTVDTFGNVGAEVKVTAGVGFRGVMVQPSVGGSYLARERTGAVTVTPEVTYWFEPMLAGSTRKMLNGIGANFALLPRLYFRVQHHDRPPSYNSYRFIHLGAEFSGEYGWGGSSDVAGRGIFSLGLTADFSVGDDGDLG